MKLMEPKGHLLNWALTSRCGISLVILTDELKHTSLLKTKEQMGSMQAGICELD